MGIPPKWIVGSVRWGWHRMWQTMMAQLAPPSREGDYLRPSSQFRHWIEGMEQAQYPPASGRYVLIAGYGCPWAHRALVVRSLKGLDDAIAVEIVAPALNSGVWKFERSFEGCQTLPELYRLATAGYSGRSTVPVLWDLQTQQIVNNESSDIIVMLNQHFNPWAAHPDLDLYPMPLQPDIDRWNEQIYHTVNNGVYRCGFAQTQSAYERACTALFKTLDELDIHLRGRRFICGSQLTLADVRLFTTLIRFDAVYHGLFKCDRRRIREYPHLWAYLRDLYQWPGVADTCRLDIIKQDYYGNLFPLNPSGIIPIGPDQTELEHTHYRETLGAMAEGFLEASSS
jgi:glutathionyl-hydroquinone reductase